MPADGCRQAAQETTVDCSVLTGDDAREAVLGVELLAREPCHGRAEAMVKLSVDDAPPELKHRSGASAAAECAGGGLRVGDELDLSVEQGTTGLNEEFETER